MTDPLNRYVVGLEREHFKIFENKLEQTLTHFSSDKAPISVGIILDMSGSMGDNILSARNSVIRFLEQGDPADEYFLVTFNDRSSLVRDFTNRSENIQNEITLKTPKGRTALYDAIYLGLEKIRSARSEKKALIIITDGEDNSSRYTFSELKDFVKESGYLSDRRRADARPPPPVAPIRDPRESLVRWRLGHPQAPLVGAAARRPRPEARRCDSALLAVPRSIAASSADPPYRRRRHTAARPRAEPESKEIVSHPPSGIA
ncbi:MAG: VWA domain-containing protein [Myxococcales bacterium]|nr:VWA domain-containing protein [Myxococcales bacterium]